LFNVCIVAFGSSLPFFVFLIPCSEVTYLEFFFDFKGKHCEYGDLLILMRVYFDIQIVAKASALGMKRGLSNLRMSLIRCSASFCSATSVDVEESLYKRAQALGIAVVTISQVCSNFMYFHS
jgi:hypothetical protein